MMDNLGATALDNKKELEECVKTATFCLSGHIFFTCVEFQGNPATHFKIIAILMKRSIIKALGESLHISQMDTA